MKVIALNTSEYPPRHSPMSQRLHCYMLALKQEGHEVKVFSFSKELFSGVYEGIPYESLVFNYKNPFIYTPNYLNALKQILYPILKGNDVFFHSEDRVSTILAIQKVANHLNVKTVIELNEFPYSYKSRRLEFMFLQFLRQRIYFNYVLKKVGGVIAISRSLESRAMRFNKNVIRIPILTKHLEIERSPGLSEIPFILHAGALSENKDGIKAVFKAFNMAQRELKGNLNLVFTVKKGLPSLMKWIGEFIIKNNLEDKVYFKGILSEEDMNRLYNDCSLAIVNKPNNLQNSHNFPTKLSELLPRKIPVVVSSTGELNYFFKNNVNCLLVEPNDILEIANSIVKIIQLDEVVEKTTSNAMMLSQQMFYYKNHSRLLSQHFSKVKLSDYDPK
jgi:glycosyltransferase involved in cell wall biosynthesis